MMHSAKRNWSGHLERMSAYGSAAVRDLFHWITMVIVFGAIPLSGQCQNSIYRVDPFGHGITSPITALDLLENGSCIAGAYLYPDSAIAVFGMNPLHELSWSFKSSDFRRVVSLKDAGDGKIYVQADQSLIKMDTTGQIIWAKQIPDIDPFQPNMSSDLLVDSNGDVTICYNWSFMLKLIRFAGDGTLLWTKGYDLNYNVYASAPHCALSAAEHDPGRHSIFVCSTLTVSAPTPFWTSVVRIDPDGEMAWAKRYLISPVGNWHGTYIAPKDDEHMIVGATKGTDVRFLVDLAGSPSGGMAHSGSRILKVEPVGDLGYASFTSSSMNDMPSRVVAFHDMSGAVTWSASPYVNVASTLPGLFPFDVNANGEFAIANLEQPIDVIVFGQLTQDPSDCGGMVELSGDTTILVSSDPVQFTVTDGVIPQPISATFYPANPVVTQVCGIRWYQWT